jgi:hypothetical protein
MDKSKIFIMFVLVSIIWAAIVLFFKNRRIRKIIAHPTKSLDLNIIDGSDVIAYPREVIVNIFFEDEKEFNYEVFSDLTLRYKDLVNGNYKVPEHIKNNRKKNIIEDNDILEERKSETSIVKDEIPFDKLIDINSIQSNNV